VLTWWGVEVSKFLCKVYAEAKRVQERAHERAKVGGKPRHLDTITGWHLLDYPHRSCDAKNALPGVARKRWISTAETVGSAGGSASQAVTA
jgi:hypothetical protein